MAPPPAPVAIPPAAEAQGPGVLETLLGEPVLAIFLVLAVGLAAGRIEVRRIGLGSAGVLFAALAYGVLRARSGVGGEGVADAFAALRQVGVVLFVYTVGLAAGPSFFRAFRSNARAVALLALVICGAGALATGGLALIAGLPADLAAGLFGGAMTSTPALAAAAEAFAARGDSAAAARVAIGYGVAYPFGVVGVVLFVQLLPRLLGKDLARLAREEADPHEAEERIARALVRVEHPGVAGRRLEEVPLISDRRCRVSRVLRRTDRGDRLEPVPPDLTLEPGMEVLVVGRPADLDVVVDFLGRRSEHAVVLDVETQRRRVIVTSPRFVGRSLRDLRLLPAYGVVVTRINRYDTEFVPAASERLQRGDALIAVGEPSSLERFAEDAGHRASAADETDLISLAAGIALGVVLGLVPVGLPGSDGGGSSFSLGMAGGPLLVALVLGHFGRIGPLTARLPRPSRVVLMELGLVLFLAGAGVQAGEGLLPILAESGPMLLAIGAAATILPMLAGFFAARWWLRMPLLASLGAICGGMTSTPGLGAISSKTDANAPAVAYATAYPVALIVVTVLAKALVYALA